MIYILRHGQTGLNRQKALQGRSDHPLNEDGIREAENVGTWFRRQGIVFTRVFSSPLVRARQTARLAAGEMAELIVDERLIEMDYGPYEGMDLTKPAPEIRTFFADFVHNPAPAGMEQLSEVVQRAGAFMDMLRETGGEGDLLISTHAILMKGILEYLTPASRGSYWSRYLGNCALYATELAEGRYTIPAEIETNGL